jgi:peptidoglycan hydrolase CwlO-like protein
MNSNTKIYLILIVILGFVGYNLMVMHDIQTDVAAFDEKIELIQSDIDSIAVANDELDSKIESLHSEIELIDSDIDKVQNNITTIKNKTNEKANNVDVLTFDELIKFFTNRYQPNQDSVVMLEVPIVKMVIKDLVTFDGAKLELVETKELLRLSNDKLVLKDSVITNLNDKVVNLEDIIQKKDEQFGLESEKSKSLEKELKRQKRNTFIWKMGTLTGTILSIFFAAGG